MSQNTPRSAPAPRARRSEVRASCHQVLYETLPDYHPDDTQPSYVLAIPCRPLVVALAALLPSLPVWAGVNREGLSDVKLR